MRSGDKPSAPRCALARVITDNEEIRKVGWNIHGILAVHFNDERVSWIERQIINQIGKRFYGRDWIHE